MFVKIGDFVQFNGLLVEFLEKRRREKINAPRKSPEKGTFLSLPFCNAPSLHANYWVKMLPFLAVKNVMKFSVINFEAIFPG